MTKIENIYGIGTCWWFSFFDENLNLAELEKYIREEIQLFEQKYSRFLENSLLSKINKERFLSNPDIETIELFNIGLKYFKLSNGYFNPALGGILENRGYDKKYSFKRSSKIESEQVVSFKDMVKIDHNEIKLISEGNIDFGGLGKGYLIDKLAKKFIEKFNLRNFIINGGGDILAYSERQREILLENPFNPGYSFLNIYLKNQALGCSSNTKRRWQDLTTREILAHIINPKKLDHLSSYGSFVIAQDALTADILATLVCILAPNTSHIQELRSKIDFEYLVIDKNMKISHSEGFKLQTNRSKTQSKY